MRIIIFERCFKLNKDVLKTMAEALLEYETIDASDIEVLLSRKPLVKVKTVEKPLHRSEVSVAQDNGSKKSAGAIDLTKPIKIES